MYFLVLLLLQFGTGWAFRYKITGTPQGTRKCLKSVFAADNVIKGKLNIMFSDGEIDFVAQDVEEDQSRYWAKSNVVAGKSYDFKFTNIHWYTPVEFCVVFRSTGSTATVTLDIDVIDETHPMLVVHDQLTSNEDQLRNVENVIMSAITMMDHLNQKERGMRDLNEATNERVRNFRLMSMISFLAVGAWEIWYLRNYFQSKIRN